MILTIRQLDEHLRVAYVLRIYARLSYTEISEVLKVTNERAMRLVFRAMQKIQEIESTKVANSTVANTQEQEDQWASMWEPFEEPKGTKQLYGCLFVDDGAWDALADSYDGMGIVRAIESQRRYKNHVSREFANSYISILRERLFCLGYSSHDARITNTSWQPGTVKAFIAVKLAKPTTIHVLAFAPDGTIRRFVGSDLNPTYTRNRMYIQNLKVDYPPTITNPEECNELNHQ